MSIQLYQLLHIFSVIILTGITFAALAAPQPEKRRRIMMWSGIISLVALVSGFGLLARLGYGFPGWVVAKVAAWLGLTMVTSLAFRLPAGQHSNLRLLTVLAVFLAVGMVIFKPF